MHVSDVGPICATVINFFSSFVARARYLPLESALDAVGQLLAWASNYHLVQSARQAGQPAALDVQLHGVFYSAVQGVLYALCFKQVQLSSGETAAFRAAITPQLQALLDDLDDLVRADAARARRATRGRAGIVAAAALGGLAAYVVLPLAL